MNLVTNKIAPAIARKEVRALWKIKEVREYTGLSDSKVRRLIAEDGLPCIHLGNQSLRFDPESVIAWVKAHEYTRN